MLKKKIEFLVSSDLDSFLARRARELDCSVGQILRDLIVREMKRRENAKTPNRADEQLVARLQRLLVGAMTNALDWPDLQQRLAALGHSIKPAGGGLTLHDLATGDRLCKSSELGFPYARFVRKFLAPMPGHPHKMAHILAAVRDIPVDDADDFDVIERISPFSGSALRAFPRSGQH